jgi:hypothetical protein
MSNAIKAGRSGVVTTTLSRESSRSDSWTFSLRLIIRRARTPTAGVDGRPRFLLYKRRNSSYFVRGGGAGNFARDERSAVYSDCASIGPISKVEPLYEWITAVLEIRLKNFLDEMSRPLTHTMAQGQFQYLVLHKIREIYSRNILVVGSRTKRVQKVRAGLKYKAQIQIVVGSSYSQMLSLRRV